MIKLLKNVVGATALVGTRLRQAYWKRASQRKPANAATPSATLPFEGSAEYWESRYAKGGHSGAGSYGPLAEFKSEFLNRFVAENEVQSVLEFGHGDGSQLELVNYRNYLGFDVSETAVNSCRQRFVGE